MWNLSWPSGAKYQLVHDYGSLKKTNFLQGNFFEKHRAVWRTIANSIK